ncbi:hypothetical protein PanWU01x14_113850 [Parasponia andersonii]|uniref:Uncharacterized protein n=1 Tax=Parasponia andersonii TaxID=3476 RepID=A0A2P5CXY4_PARAD|nr:hypothetical protein PanWU01x14_113850 [Parasponia andersonii]
MPTPFSSGIRIFIDVVFKNKEAAAGVVTKDDFDRILLVATSILLVATTSIFAAYSMLEAEFWALNMGLL